MRSKKHNRRHSLVARVCNPCSPAILYPLSSILAFSLLTGCQSAHTPTPPLVATLSGNDPAAQMDFWHTLATRPLTTNDDAFHGLLLYLDGQDDSKDYASRLATLKSRDLLPTSFDAPADSPATHGTLSTPIVRILHLKGGVNMALFGPTPRYATRLLVYKGIYPDSSPNQAISGSDFVGLIGKLEDSERNTTEKPAALLPSEPVAQSTDDANDPVARVSNPCFLSLNLSENFTDESSPLSILNSDPLFLADNPATSPTTTPAISTEVIIDGIEGKFVQVRPDSNSPWQPAQVGQKFGPNAEFRTGPKSAVRFIIPPDQTYTLDRVSTLKVAQILPQGYKLTTEVQMTYGRVRYDLEPIAKDNRGAPRGPEYQISETGIEHATTIRSPNSTLAVRGTRVALYDQPPYAPQALSLVGRAEFRNARRQIVAFGGKKTVTNHVNANTPSAAEVALADTIVDPTIRLARTSEDQQLLTNLAARGAVITFDRGSGLNIVRGGFPPTTDAQLLPNLPGQLNFVLRWTGDADLNLNVSNQGVNGKNPDYIYPSAGLTTGPSGGRTRFDHRGGPHGGIEVVYWTKNAPAGFYAAGVDFVSGAPTAFTLDIFKDGKRIPAIDSGANGGSGGLVLTTRGKVDPKNRHQAVGPVPVGIPVPPLGPPGQTPGVSASKNTKPANKPAKLR